MSELTLNQNASNSVPVDHSIDTTTQVEQTTRGRANCVYSRPGSSEGSNSAHDASFSSVSQRQSAAAQKLTADSPLRSILNASRDRSGSPSGVSSAGHRSPSQVSSRDSRSGSDSIGPGDADEAIEIIDKLDLEDFFDQGSVDGKDNNDELIQLLEDDGVFDVGQDEKTESTPTQRREVSSGKQTAKVKPKTIKLESTGDLMTDLQNLTSQGKSAKVTVSFASLANWMNQTHRRQGNDACTIKTGSDGKGLQAVPKSTFARKPHRLEVQIKEGNLVIREAGQKKETGAAAQMRDHELMREGITISEGKGFRETTVHMDRTGKDAGGQSQSGKQRNLHSARITSEGVLFRAK